MKNNELFRIIIFNLKEMQMFGRILKQGSIFQLSLLIEVVNPLVPGIH